MAINYTVQAEVVDISADARGPRMCFWWTPMFGIG